MFTIDSVYEINKLTKQSTGELKQFTVTADSAGGDVNLSISPAIISTGQYQNVDALPVVNADLVFLGTASTAYPQALAFHPDAFAIGFCDLDLPNSGIIKGARMVEDGMSIRCIQYYDGDNSVQKMRFDVLFGAQAVIPEHACRIYTP